MHFSLRSLILSVVLAICVTACVDNPVRTEAHIDLPEAVMNSEFVMPVWHQLLNAPQIGDLVSEALHNNPDWQATAARLQASTALVAADSRWPNVDLTIEQQRSDNHSVISNSASAGLRVNWELDLWGRLAQQELASEMNALSAVEETQWARFSLSAQVVKAWLDVQFQHQQLLLIEQRQNNLKQNLEVIQDGFNNGSRQALDLYSAQAEYANGEAEVLDAQRSARQSVLQLNRLLGRYPGQAWSGEYELPEVALLPPHSLSSTLLERRPDVQAAGYALAAQRAQAKVAQRNRWPVFSLTARAGYASNTLADVADGQHPFWSAIGNITQPLFKGQALKAESRRQVYLYEAALADYQSTAQNAFREALVVLNQEQSLYQQWQAAQRAAAVSEQAEQQALERYLSGLENFNTWLQAQRSAFSRRQGVLNLQAQLLSNRIDLYLALGGDWNIDLPSPSPIDTPSERDSYAS